MASLFSKAAAGSDDDVSDEAVAPEAVSDVLPIPYPSENTTRARSEPVTIPASRTGARARRAPKKRAQRARVRKRSTGAPRKSAQPALTPEDAAAIVGVVADAMRANSVPDAHVRAFTDLHAKHTLAVGAGFPTGVDVPIGYFDTVLQTAIREAAAAGITIPTDVMGPPTAADALSNPTVRAFLEPAATSVAGTAASAAGQAISGAADLINETAANVDVGEVFSAEQLNGLREGTLQISLRSGTIADVFSRPLRDAAPGTSILSIRGQAAQLATSLRDYAANAVASLDSMGYIPETDTFVAAATVASLVGGATKAAGGGKRATAGAATGAVGGVVLLRYTGTSVAEIAEIGRVMYAATSWLARAATAGNDTDVILQLQRESAPLAAAVAAWWDQVEAGLRSTGAYVAIIAATAMETLRTYWLANAPLGAQEFTFSLVDWHASARAALATQLPWISPTLVEVIAGTLGTLLVSWIAWKLGGAAIRGTYRVTKAAFKGVTRLITRAWVGSEVERAEEIGVPGTVTAEAASDDESIDFDTFFSPDEEITEPAATPAVTTPPASAVARIRQVERVRRLDTREDSPAVQAARANSVRLEGKIKEKLRALNAVFELADAVREASVAGERA